MKTKVLLFALLISFVCYNYAQADCEKKILDRVIRDVTGGNGSWWNPFDSGWERVTTDKITYEDGSTLTRINCSGNDDLDCPTYCVFIGGGGHTPLYDREFNGDPIHDAHIEHLLYIEAQAAAGVFSGEKTFPDIITVSGVYHRVVIWNGDASGVSIDSQIYNCQ